MCTLVGWGPVESNGDVIGDKCEVQMCSLGIFKHTESSYVHGYLAIGVLPTAYLVYFPLVGLLCFEMAL